MASILKKDSLGGKSKTVMIDTNRKETLNTLEYTNHARNIQNKAAILQRKTEKASMSTKSCIDCREKESEIRDLKEKVVKLEMEKANSREKVKKLEMENVELIDSLNASKKMRMAMDGDLNKEGHKNDLRNQGYKSSSRLEDMDTSETEYLDDSDDDDWAPKSEKEEKLYYCPCSIKSYCKTMRCPCRASGGSCGTSSACVSRKCANSRTVKGGSPEFQIHEFPPN